MRWFLCVMAVVGVMWSQVALAQPSSPVMTPELEDSSWEPWEWGVMMGSGVASAVGGGIGAFVLYRNLAEPCPPSRGTFACMESNLGTSTLVIASGMVLASGMSTLGVGDALGHRADVGWVFGGATLGLMGLALPFTCLTCDPNHPEFRVYAGLLLSALMVPAASVMYAWITDAERKKYRSSTRGTSALEYQSGEGWRVGAPVPVASPEAGQGFRVWLPLMKGQF